MTKILHIPKIIFGVSRTLILIYTHISFITSIKYEMPHYYSLVDTYSDGMGNLDFRRSQNGSGMSRNAQVLIL